MIPYMGARRLSIFTRKNGLEASFLGFIVFI